ncbi:cytochrome P450 4C1-like isoform X2 [Uranotaenia lowii]|uniref:cytochrome P450 4C1-like isoform X2 n=1 Tax=Uranotaenia lowii TaxID=190385 RepID=UPI00247A2BC7|nr:cytochrome P450 4C1-like isoform X2 [Uranotaenia lowii]
MISFVILIGLLIFLVKRFLNSDSFHLRTIPTPSSYPVIGNLALFAGLSKCDTFQLICDHFRQFPRCFRNLFLDIDWKEYRKMLNPAFNQKILSGFVSIFDQCARALVEALGNSRSRSEIDLLPFTSHCTLQMICQSSLGSDIASDPKTIEFCNILEELLGILSARVFKLAFYNEWIYRRSESYRRQQAIRAKMRSLIEPVIKQKRESMKTNMFLTNLEDKEFDRKPRIFVDQLLQMERNEQKISLDEIQNHIYTIIGAGNETSALQSSFVLLMLAMNPDIQEKVFLELNAIYTRSDEPLNYNSLKSQSYLEAVIKETLRLFPVAPMVGRQTLEPIQLGQGLPLIPAGVTILINLFVLHRRPDLWGPTANQFNPNRFLAKEISNQHPFAFIPFAGGPRNCIGYRYAMLSMKAIVSHVVRNFKLSTRLRMEQLRLYHEVTLRLEGGFLVTVVKRTQSSES